MDAITVVLVVLGFLLPSVTGLINSAADRNRDAGKAGIIAAQRGDRYPCCQRGRGRRDV
ncbi:hypothetical protein [Streptomyces bluensis]|uniref:Uncharacterized protein n=1 Tax=Streptomyces bluensis TaxID=33897 RepID=A0ABW6UEC0_9ACTN|nr:hypothetical protein [Streptomyces bluensis]GGZ50379.1 hypothetical protein GCM10010344_15100 [Streptomyces bluensis]